MGEYAPAHAVSRFEDGYFHVLLFERVGSGKTGKACTDHDHAGLFANVNASERAGGNNSGTCKQGGLAQKFASGGLLRLVHDVMRSIEFLKTTRLYTQLK